MKRTIVIDDPNNASIQIEMEESITLPTKQVLVWTCLIFGVPILGVVMIALMGGR